MDQQYIVPRVAFVINLAADDSQQLGLSRLHHLIHLFSSHRVSATWAIGDASTAQILREQTDASEAHQVALNMQALNAGSKSSSRGFTQQISQELARLAAVMGQTPSVVLGNSARLRSRLVLLSQLGIETILSDSSDKASRGRSRPLPCGMWQLTPCMQLPHTRILDRLTRRGPSVREMIASAVDATTLVRINANEFEKLSARSMQTFEKLLREVSWAASRGQIEQSPLAEIVGNLRQRRQMKPQRSIMRVAA